MMPESAHASGGRAPHGFSITALCATILLLSFASPPTLVAQISVQVNLVNVPVTVTGRGGQFVSGLGRENFRLLVDGAEQPIEYFAPEQEPARVLVLVETGPAVYLLRREHISAAGALLNGLGPDDRVAVASYSDASRLLLDFTTDKRQAAASLSGLVYGLGAAQLNFYDSLASAATWVESGGGKSAIVALTTGLDSLGADSWQRLAERLRRSNVLVLPVALGGELRGVKMPREKGAIGEETSFARSDSVLQTIAAETGGHVFFPRSRRDFEEAYRRVASLLRHQYSLGFTAPTRDGRQHTIQVQVVDDRGRPFDGKLAKPAYGVNFRRGFLAPAS
jgi:Ca-activated chloride channel family protein